MHFNSSLSAGMNRARCQQASAASGCIHLHPAGGSSAKSTPCLQQGLPLRRHAALLHAKLLVCSFSFRRSNSIFCLRLVCLTRARNLPTAVICVELELASSLQRSAVEFTVPVTHTCVHTCNVHGMSTCMYAHTHTHPSLRSDPYCQRLRKAMHSASLPLIQRRSSARTIPFIHRYPQHPTSIPASTRGLTV